jgi:predicted ATPase
MEELAPERAGVCRAVELLHLSPVLFELGARAHPPRTLYRSYLDQSHVFVAIYWERYGWIAPGMEVSGLEDEYLLAGAKPKLVYVKRPAPEREPRLNEMLDRIRASDEVSYKSFSNSEELERLVADDLAFMVSEAFLTGASPDMETATQIARRPRLTLPADASTFVGRESELEDLRALLRRDDVRLVTLTGPGGIGKTRLGLRVAADLAPEFDERAAFVQLASIRDAQLVPGAIADAVGLRDLRPEATLSALMADLAERSLLLVLDNFEQVLDAGGMLPELLGAAPRVKVLLTSREALRLRAEHEYVVPPLAPDECLRLFDERAGAARHDFRIDGTNAETIASICRRLEFVPLAIELAAARARLLPPEALLERLDHRLDFLVSGPRDLPERQQTLRRTIQWSYDLLDADERQLFVELGTFVGSFSLAAALAVSTIASEQELLDLLASLVDKSLLQAEPTASEPRFRMLEMIAEFARELLAATPERAELARRHAAFYRDLSAELGEAVRGPDQRRWLERLGRDGEANNFRAAMAWFLREHQLDDLVEMAWALWVPAWINGQVDEGRRLASAALAADGTMSALSRARLLVVAGMFNMWSGAHDVALTELMEATSTGRTLGDEQIVAYATLAWSMLTGPVDGEARSEELAQQCLDLFRRLADPWAEAAALNVLGWLYVSQERFEGNGPLFAETLAKAEAAGDVQFIGMAEVNLAEYHLDRGDAEQAADLLASCASRHRSARLRYSVAYLLDAAARLATTRGDATRAATLLGAASQMRTTVGVSVWGSQLERRERLVEQLRATLGAAAFSDATNRGAAMRYSEALDRMTGD